MTANADGRAGGGRSRRDRRADDPPRIALVMSGGGARGAYEAGVLSYLFQEFSARLGRPAHFDIVTGILDRINEPIIAQRNTGYRIVRDLMLRPSKDLGEVAAECLRHQPRNRRVRDWLSRSVVRYAGRGAFGEADLVSYLLFDHCYAGPPDRARPARRRASGG